MKTIAILALAGLCLAGTAGAQPAYQVADINTTQTGGTDAWPYQAQFVELGSTVVFNVSDGRNGMEIWSTDGTAAGTHLIKDICPGVCDSHPFFLTVVGSRVFFKADDGVHGAELWSTDGTAAGTQMVADLAPGSASSNPSELRELAGKLLFTTRGSSTGDGELWLSDGTAAGTAPFSNIEPGPERADPFILGRLADVVLFSARTAAEGRELWRTDGTAAGTWMVSDIQPGSGDSLPSQGLVKGIPTYAAVSGGLLYFAADDGVHGDELWASDGTAAGTRLVKDIDTTAASGASPWSLAPFAGGVLFRASEAAHGAELWTSDGTEAGTSLVLDITAGTLSSSPWEIVPAGARAFFRADDGSHGGELWTTDGTAAGTSLVLDIQPGAGSGLPVWFMAEITPAGGSVLFFADDGVHGEEPWVSDGTAAGTALLADVEPGAGSSFPSFVPDRTLATGGRWYFRAATAAGGLEVWTSDGTAAGTHELAEINDQTSAFYVFFQQLYGPRSLAGTGDGGLYFQADDGISGGELWHSDGTAAGTARVADIQPGARGSFPFEIAPLGGAVLFRADDGANVSQLWRSDGTPAGTTLVKTIDASAFGSPNRLTPLGGLVLFAGTSDDLWRSDGTAAGTVPLGAGARLSDDPAPLGSSLLFVSDSGSGGAIWTTDGSTPGTLLVKDFPTGPPEITAPSLLTTAGNRVFFAGPTNAEGRELWSTDGTAAGTVLVKDVVPGPGSGLPLLYGHGSGGSYLEAFGSSVLFVADDGVHGLEPWISDGTAAGTALLADLCPGACSSDPEFRTAGGKVFFAAGDGVHGRELWVSDGTAAGTSLLDIAPGIDSSLPQGLTAIGRALLFSAWDPDHGREPWVSDGTPSGTRRVQDIAPGALSSSPLEITLSGPRVYFAANDNTHGFELWALPRAALGSALTATMTAGGPLAEGTTVTYTIVLTNSGLTLQPDAPGPELTDVLPAGLALTGASASAGAVTTDGPSRTVTWNGSIPAGASVTITVQAVIQPGTLGATLSNQAALAWDADVDGLNEAAGVSDDPAAAGGSNPTVFTVVREALDYYTVSPCRLIDTRTTSALASDLSQTIQIAGSCGVPTTAKAVTVNLTVVDATGAGHLVVWPASTPLPATSTVNFMPGVTQANNAVVALAGGALAVRPAVNGGGSVQLLIDVSGYFQ